MNPRRVLHLIGQAHLDPVWLWPWQDGCSEALTTLQSAVNFLESEPDFCFTRSSSWVYRVAQRCDPRLFTRIRAFVAEGRWEIVGGWVEQPDCNMPATESFVRQSLYGRAWFRQAFDLEVGIGYNVDSFGHAAGLPQLLAGAGFTHYVFMRPSTWEVDLPPLFWWEGPDGSRVLTWRLPQNYGQSPDSDGDFLEKEIRRAAKEGFAPGMTNGMFFFGVGNHGGGPTRLQIDRIRLLQKDQGLPELRFSTVGRFFAAVEAERAFRKLPVIQGELQRHAVGCYSAHRAVKADLRRVERRLILAETAGTAGWLAGRELVPEPAFADAWEALLFNQFHDILGGTCTASNDVSIRDRFGAAAQLADEAAVHVLHRLARSVDLEGLAGGALFLWNPLPWARKALVDFDAAMAPGGGRTLSHLAGPSGAVHPIQWRGAEACFGPVGSATGRLTAVVDLPPCGYRVFTLESGPVHGGAGSSRPPQEDPGGPEPWVGSGAPGVLDGRIGLSVWQDTGDTWGHRLNGYEELLGRPEMEEAVCLAEGPVVRVLRQRAVWKNSEILFYVSQWCHLPGIEIRVRFNWQQSREILRLEIPTRLRAVTTVAAVPGAVVTRPTDGGEFPANDWVALTGRLGRGRRHSCVLVAEGGLSYSSAGGRLRVIVARSAYYAHHRPHLPPDPLENPFLDQGWQEARYWLQAGPGAPETLGAHRFAAEVLHPAERVVDSAHPGDLPREASFLEIEPAGVALIACKRAEDGEGWIVRLQEMQGRKSRCRIRSRMGRSRSWRLTLKAHELVSVRLPLRGRSGPRVVDLLENPMKVEAEAGPGKRAVK